MMRVGTDPEQRSTARARRPWLRRRADAAGCGPVRALNQPRTPSTGDDMQVLASPAG